MQGRALIIRSAHRDPMRIELQPGLFLQQGTFSAVVAPEEVAISLINGNADLQRFLFLFVSGNFSRILSDIHRTAGNFMVQRAFTAHQLLTVLRTASASFVFVEHDPTLYDGAYEMVTPLALALDELARESTVVIYSPTADRAFRSLTRDAHRVYYLTAPPPRPYSRTGAFPGPGKAVDPFAQQKTLEAFLERPAAPPPAPADLPAPDREPAQPAFCPADLLAREPAAGNGGKGTGPAFPAETVHRHLCHGIRHVTAGGCPGLTDDEVDEDGDL